MTQHSIDVRQRITGLHQKTILDLLVLAGARCEKLMTERIKGIAVKDVEADEIWGFVQCNNRHTLYKQITDPHVGDSYTFVGIERNTKLVLAWHLGERGREDTEAFTVKLNDAALACARCSGKPCFGRVFGQHGSRSASFWADCRTVV